MPRVQKTVGRGNNGRPKKRLSKFARFALDVFAAIDDELRFCDAMFYRRRLLIAGLDCARIVMAEDEIRETRAQFRKMRERGLILGLERDGRIEYVLTEKGKELLLRLKMKTAEPDGKRTIVSYDIPENARRKRDALRELLKASGFRMIHQSTWSVGADVGEHVRAWSRKHDLAKWVKVIVAD